MKRDELQILINWQNKPDRKPLLLRGARQVGKTWLMKEFGRTQFKQVAYINLESNPAIKEVFQGDYDIKRILTALSIASGIPIEPENTLIILDEIQEFPCCDYLAEVFPGNAPQYAGHFRRAPAWVVPLAPAHFFFQGGKEGISGNPVPRSSYPGKSRGLPPRGKSPRWA